MNVLICDGVRPDAQKLTNILAYSYGSGMKTEYFAKPSDVVTYFHGGAAVDVCFLAILMPEMDGIELARTLRSGGYNGGIIFITSSREYGPEAFEVKALDYLLKPLMPQAVRKAVNKWKAGRKCYAY